MRRYATLFIIALIFSCTRKADSVVFWKLEDSRLYLNPLEKTLKLKQTGSDYDLYVSLKHADNLNKNAIRFKIGINDVIDTMLFPLVDTNDKWIGKPCVGSYVVKKMYKEKFNTSDTDSIKLSISPISSNVTEGIEWIAVELKAK